MHSQRDAMYNVMLCTTLCYVQRYAMYNVMLCTTLCYVQRYAMYNVMLCTTLLDFYKIVHIAYEYVYVWSCVCVYMHVCRRKLPVLTVKHNH